MACTQILLPTGPLLLRVRPFDFWGGYGWFQKKNILQTDFEGKNSCMEILYLAKKDSYTEKTIFRGVWLWKKILQRGRCMSVKKFYHQRVWGKNSFPAKSPWHPRNPTHSPSMSNGRLFLLFLLFLCCSAPLFLVLLMFPCSMLLLFRTLLA